MAFLPLWTRLEHALGEVPFPGLLALFMVFSIVLWLAIVISVPRRRGRRVPPVRGSGRRPHDPGDPPFTPRADRPWYYVHGEETAGPLELAGLIPLYRNGTIGADTLVWQNGMRAWKPLQELPVILRHVAG
jgi:hypothetical protein